VSIVGFITVVFIIRVQRYKNKLKIIATKKNIYV
jgi:hypothetical protein